MTGPDRTLPQVPRMEDVAQRAGVALGTVSNVLNRPGSVSAHTRARVEQAINELGFVPNRAARSLAAGTSTTIGMVLADLTNSFFVDMARGAEQVAARHGMNVVLANSDVQESRQQTYIDLFRQERMAGILLAPLTAIDAAKLRGVGTRSLVFLNEADVTDACTVSVDNELGGFLAAQHLIESGRRRILFAGDPDDFRVIRERLRGVQRAVTDAGNVSLEVARTTEVRAVQGHKIGHELITRAPQDRPDGVVAAADLLALGIVQVLVSESDIRIPEDIAVTGYDNNSAAWDSLIPITTIAQPGEEIGSVAASLLLHELSNPTSHQHEHRVLEPRLIVRASTRSGLGPAH